MGHGAPGGSVAEWTTKILTQIISDEDSVIQLVIIYLGLPDIRSAPHRRSTGSRRNLERRRRHNHWGERRNELRKRRLPNAHLAGWQNAPTIGCGASRQRYERLLRKVYRTSDEHGLRRVAPRQCHAGPSYGRITVETCVQLGYRCRNRSGS